MNMKKIYHYPQTEVLNMEMESLLAASVKMGEEGKDNVEFETRKRYLIWKDE